MRIKPEQLAQHLSQSLAPIYLIAGEDPLLVGEAADAVRARARELGHATREVLDAGASFDWSGLQQSADSLSLFAERRLLELRLPEPKPGAAGAKVLEAYTDNPPADTVLLVITGRMDKATQNSRWVSALERVGVVVILWPISPQQLPGWIAQRMRRKGLAPDSEAIAVLADRVEGNLLAAAQEIERLHLLHGAGRIDGQMVAASVADSARFDVYKLADAALEGDTVRCCRVLRGLRAEGVEPILVLWALTREVRALASMAYDVAQGANSGRVVAAHRVWESRKRLVGAALRRGDAGQWQRLLQRCARIDQMIKGLAAGRPWEELELLLLAMSGATAPGVGLASGASF